MLRLFCKHILEKDIEKEQFGKKIYNWKWVKYKSLKYSKFPRTIVLLLYYCFFFSFWVYGCNTASRLFPLIPFPWNNLCTNSQHSHPTTIPLKKVRTNKNKIVYSKMESTNIHFSYLYLFSTVFAAVMIKRANFENLWIQWMIVMIIVIELNVRRFFYCLIFSFFSFLSVRCVYLILSVGNVYSAYSVEHKQKICDIFNGPKWIFGN